MCTHAPALLHGHKLPTNLSFILTEVKPFITLQRSARLRRVAQNAQILYSIFTFRIQPALSQVRVSLGLLGLIGLLRLFGAFGAHMAHHTSPLFAIYSLLIR